MDALSADDIGFLYRAVLKREPENEAIVTAWRGHSWRGMLEALLESDEFKTVTLLQTDNRECMKKILYYKTKFGFLMPISLSEPMTMACYVLDDYEEEESKFVFENIMEGDHCIDVGARHGWFSGIMAQRVGPLGRVYAFEPGPPASGPLEVARANGFEWLRFIAKGLSSEAGTVSFDPATLSMIHGHASIKVVRLDDQLRNRTRPISMMKADIEGAEYLMLQGGLDLIRQDKPTIVMELSPLHQMSVSRVSIVDVYDLVVSLGYDCVDMQSKPISRENVESAAEHDAVMNVAFVAA